MDGLLLRYIDNLYFTFYVVLAQCWCRQHPEVMSAEQKRILNPRSRGAGGSNAEMVNIFKQGFYFNLDDFIN